MSGFEQRPPERLPDRVVPERRFFVQQLVLHVSRGPERLDRRIGVARAERDLAAKRIGRDHGHRVGRRPVFGRVGRGLHERQLGPGLVEPTERRARQGTRP